MKKLTNLMKYVIIYFVQNFEKNMIQNYLMGGYNMFKRLKNRMEFQADKNLYVAKPLVTFSDSWAKLKDVPNEQKATKLFFDALTGKKLFLSFIRKNGTGYAKLYIVDSNQIDILYVKSETVNPVQRYHGKRTQVK